jgi:hypothetical protein
LRDHPRNPTLLIGLGAFGREVLDLAVRGPARIIPNLGRIEASIAKDAPTSAPSAGSAAGEDIGPVRVTASAEGLPQAVIAPALRRLRALLDLGHYVDHTEPTDPRGPRCDVFLIGDLAEPGVAEVVAKVAGALAEEIRAEFHSILRAGDGALSVCPLLCAPREADAEAVATAARALLSVAHSRDVHEHLDARIYMVEDQSGKYLLSRAELVRSFAAFLHLLLFSGLRDDEEGARSLVERSATGARALSESSGPFATFACATLELDHRSLARLCAVKLAREVLGCFREGKGATITEITAEGAKMVPDRGRLESELWQESSAGSLEKHLEPPSIDVPEIAWSDTPEDIVERKFSALYRARVTARMRAFREDVERIKMDRLALEIEKCGKASLERVQEELAEAIKREVEAGPRGHARAIEILRDALTRAKGKKEEVEAEIESPDLSPFPGSPLDAGLYAIHEAAFYRPRRFRMNIFGALGIFLSMALLGGVVLGGYRALLAPDPPFFELAAPPPEGAARAFVTWPMPFVIGAVIGAGSTYYRLWKHYKRHHNWVAEARDSLDQALKKHLSRDVVSYFYRRLHYTRLLWVQRIYRSVVERIEEAILALEGARAALEAADGRLAQEERALASRFEVDGTRGGILFRGVLSPGDAEGVYDELKPANVEAIAERFLREALRREPWMAAPFTDTTALLEVAAKELARLDAICPFKPDSEVLFRCASEAARSFLQKLALKLSPPLATAEIAGLEAPRPRHIAVVPPEAEELIREILAGENLRGGWDVRALSKDARRIHLLIERGELPIEALRLGRAPSKPGRPA